MGSCTSRTSAVSLSSIPFSGVPRSASGCRCHGADDQGIEPALPPAVRGAGRSGAGERDGRRPAAETAAAKRVRADPPRAGRTVLRRAARGQQARGDGLGGGARRGPRRRLRRRESGLSHRSLHPHGTRRGAGPAAESRRGASSKPCARRVSIPVTVKIRLGWKNDSRNYLDLARAAADARRGGDHRARPDARGTLPVSGGVGRHRGGGRGRADTGRRQRRPALSARDSRAARGGWLRRRDGRAWRARSSRGSSGK